MHAQSVRTALGTLQNNPDDSEAWQELRDALSEEGGDLDHASALALLSAARERHASRGEAEAVVRIYDLCAAESSGTAAEVSFLQQRAAVLLTELFAGLPAIATLARAASLPQADAGLEAELEALQARAAGWRDQAASYHAEAESAPDDLYRSAMIMRAAEAEICFAEEPRVPAIVENLEMALRLDPSNLPASRLLEVIYRRAGDTAGLVRVLERTADRAPSQEARVAAGIRLGRYLVHTLRDEEFAAHAFDRVLESDPENADAMAFVSEYYTRTENWDALVRVYERPLKVAAQDEQKLGEMLQVAMLHWKKREVLADAEPWFERIRKLEPAHEDAIAFYREYKAALKDDVGLAQVLDEAKRALDLASPERASLEAELSSHASSQADLQRQIEQQKSLLRNNPDDAAARERLKTLYKQTQGHNALVELLRQELERTPEQDLETRLAVMREIAGVYREYIKSDTALVGVLNQIVQLDGKLDEHDVGEVRELVSLFDKLGRPRDLLASQKLLAEIAPDLEEKKLLYRQVGRRWLDQFSNVQHAMEAFAALYALDPSDEEAIERLDDLYRKRRAWKELFALYDAQLANKTGVARIPLLREMAQLAAEHLSRVDDALAYFREILDLDASRLEVLDRYEKYAERSKNWTLLADALERRLAAGGGTDSQLPILQKLGTVYSDHLDRPAESVRTWQRVVETQPGNARAMRVLRDSYLRSGEYDALELIYVGQKDLEGLAEVLSTAADRARDSEAKLDLSYRAARVYEEGLQQSARAIRSYERILSVDPDDVRAIDRLLPLYENDEKWGRVPPLLEVKYRLAQSDDERVTLLSQLFTVASSHLFDRRAAIQYARRAFALSPRDARCLEMFDSASRAGGGWEEMQEALEQRLLSLGGPLHPVSVPPPAAVPKELPGKAEAAPKRKRGGGGKRRGKGKATEETVDPPVAADIASPGLISLPPMADLSDDDRAERRAVGLRLARVLGEEMGRVDEAVQRLKALAGEFEDDGEILDLLEAMLRRQASKSDLRWLYHHREKRAKDATDKAVVLLEWAQFEEREVGKPEAALELYRRVLVDGPGSVTALDAVVRLATELGQPQVAIEALERHRELAEGRERADKEVELATLYLAADRFRDALSAVQRALDSGSEPGLVIPTLQRLAELPDLRAEATRILSEQYEAGGDARKESEALRSLIAETTDPGQKVELCERLASVYEQKLAEPGSALGVVLDGLRIVPGSLELWDRAHELAGASGRPVELADTYREILATDLETDVLLALAARAGELHETILGDNAGAVPYYEKILAVRPDDEDAFIRLREILTAAERWQELEQLYDREIARLEDPARQLEMLAEVALLAEDIMGDPARAAVYHNRILKLEPAYSVSLEALDRIYSRLGQKKQLLDVLDRRAELTSGTELAGLLLRTGQIALGEHEPERAMTAIERVLEDEPDNYEARDVAERLLEIGSVRVRASRCLEVVYEAQDEIRDLVRVLAVRVEALRPDEDQARTPKDLAERESERRDLLRRIATLKDDRLHDDEGSFDVFAELSPLDPDDLDLRERLIDSGRRLGRGVEVIAVLLAAEKNANLDTVKAEILSQAAAVQQDNGDLLGAEATLGRVMELAETEPEAALVAARQLEALLVRGARHGEVVRNLQFQIRLESDFERKAELLARVAQLSVEVLGDPEQAISAWETRLGDNPDDGEALQNLTELYERAERYQDLGRVLVLRRDAAVASQERLRIVRHLADVQERHLGDISQAIESYQVLLEEGGADPSSYKALVRLFQKEERYDDLAEVLARQADVVEERAEELEALALLGQVKSDHLGDALGATEAYRRALGLDERHQPSLLSLGMLLEHEEPNVRLDAAAILEPIYAASRNHEGLIRVLTTQAEASDDPTFIAQCFERCAEIYEDLLKDPTRALAAVDRGMQAAAKVGELGKWIQRLERLAEATGDRKKQVEVLTNVAPDMYDAAEQLEVQKRVAELQRDALGDAEAAIAAYRKALDMQEDDKESLLSLEKLHLARKEYAELLDVLERREGLAQSDAERKALAYRRAELLAVQMAQSDRAIEVYESILDDSFESPALEAVEKLYAAGERWDDLVVLNQRRIDSTDRGVATLRVKLAAILWEKQHDRERALDELEQALGLESQHVGAVRYLESRLEDTLDPAERARVAALLEPVYMLKSDYASVLRALELRLLGVETPEDRREFLVRIAKIHEEQREDYAAALEVTAQLLSADIADTGALEEMERLAKVAGNGLRLAELLEAAVLADGGESEEAARLSRRAGELFAGEGQDARALVLLRRAQAFQMEDVRLFELIDGLLVRSGSAQDRIEVHRAALEHRYDPDQQIRLLHVIARLSKDALADADAAIDAHQRVLSIDDQNVSSQDELTVLYAAAGRFEELSELYLRRAEPLAPADAARYRLALSALYANRLGQPEAALDQLEEIVRELPQHEDAIARIEALRSRDDLKARVVEILRPIYETQGDWRKIVRLNEDRFRLAEDAHEKLAILRETAELWELRGEDAERALRVFAEAVRLVPDDDACREDVERLVLVTARWQELADLYVAVLEENPDLLAKADILRRLVEVLDERLDSPRPALERAAELLELDPSDEWALRRMMRLATLLGDWVALERCLKAESEASLGEAEQIATLLRLGELRLLTLGDEAGAVSAYEQALEIDDRNAAVLDRLIGIHEARQEAGRLVDLYLMRVETADADDDLRFGLQRKAAQLLETKLGEPERAIEALGQALIANPGDGDTIAELNRLYRAQKMWSELLDNLRLEAGTADSGEKRLAVRHEIARILAAELESYDESLEAYGIVLDERPDDEVALAAVFSIAKKEEHLRPRAADLLVPALRQTGLRSRLVEALELRHSTEQDPLARVETLRAIAQINETELGDHKAALGALLRAIVDAPDARDLYSDLERLAEATGMWAKLAEGLAERATEAYDSELSAELWVRVARIREVHQSQVPKAIAAYQKAADAVGDRADLLDALDRLHTAEGDTAAVVELLERRMALADTDEAQSKILTRQGQLLLEKQKEPAEALRTLRSALERDLRNDEAAELMARLLKSEAHFEEAFDVLDDVYRRRSSGTQLSALHQLRVDAATNAGQRLEMRRSLAEVLEHDCQDALAAQRVLQAALADDVADVGIQDDVERLANVSGSWAEAALSLLLASEAATDMPQDVRRDAAQRAALWFRDRADDKLGAERALVSALAFAPKDESLLEQLDVVLSESGRDADLLTIVQRRVDIAGGEAERLELLWRVEGLADKLGKSDVREGALRSILEIETEDARALEQLTALRRLARDFQETYELLLRRTRFEADAATLRALRVDAASIAQAELGQLEEATTILEAIFEEAPDDQGARDALSGAYVTAGRYTDLDRLLRRLIDSATDPVEVAALTIRLARVRKAHFADVDGAVELLEAVYDANPSDHTAALELSGIYQEGARHADLANLLERQVAAHRRAGEGEAALALQKRLALLCEAPLGDLERAAEAWTTVRQEEDSEEALEALFRLRTALGQQAQAAEVLDELATRASGQAAISRLVDLAHLYTALGNREAAVTSLDRAFAVDPDSRELRQQLRMEYEQAEAWQSVARMILADADATEEKKTRVDLYREAANVYLAKLGDPSTGADVLQKAVDLSPDDRSLLLDLCDAVSLAGRGAEAVQVLEKIALSFGGKRSKELGEIHRRLANAYLAMGQREQALGELDKAFRIEPGNIFVLRQLGEVAMESGDTAKAQQMFRALLLQRLDGQSPISKAQVFCRLGQIHQSLGEGPKAKQMFERAIQTDPQLAEAKAALASFSMPPPS
jgi:tetratricopeptide (TPR) repeat protein